MKNLNLLIIDDHPLFRKGIISVVSDAKIFSNIYESSTIKETFEILEQQKIDFITLDLNLPDGDGVCIIDKILNEREIPILVITTYNSSLLARDVIRRGAKGYIAKENISDNLIDAINAILHGGNYLDVSGEMSEVDSYDDKNNLFFTLTAAERQIFRLLAEGKTPKEIAYETGRSLKTIENQRISIMNKLKLKSMNELIKLALKLDLIDI